MPRDPDCKDCQRGVRHWHSGPGWLLEEIDGIIVGREPTRMVDRLTPEPTKEAP